MKTMELFEVRAGDEHYFVAAPEFSKGMEVVFDRHGAKMMSDIPKPFSFDRVKPTDAVLVFEPKARKAKR